MDQQVGNAAFPRGLGREVRAVRGLTVKRKLCRCGALEDRGTGGVEKSVQRLIGRFAGGSLTRHGTERALQESAVDLVEIEMELLVMQRLG